MLLTRKCAMDENNRNEEDYTVMKQVKAQVMSRDDSSGGWVPVAGGGMSFVALRRIVSGHEDEYNVVYKISGHRQTDNFVVLQCTLSIDLQYVAANPTFHHWQTCSKRYGLAFQSSADGRSFERSVRLAAYEMQKQYISVHATRPSTADEDIFMMLHFEKESSRSGTKCTAGRAVSAPSHFHRNGRITTPGCRCASCVFGRASNPVLLPPKLPLRPNSVSLMERRSSCLKSDLESSIKVGSMVGLLKVAGDDAAYVDSSYVRFTKSEADLSPVAVTHEYCYPAVEPRNVGRTSDRLDVAPPRSRLPMNMRTISAVAGVRCTRPLVQCMYCCEPFDPELGNGRRKCPDAPDRVMDWINVASCVCVADTVSYHCCADSEGEYQPACACTRLSFRSVMKWTGIVLMSMFLPCLCCFWPLVGCRRCAMVCGYCVPQHRAA